MAGERALVAWAKRQLGRPFRWGETDCAALLRRGLEIYWGQDRLAGLPTWSSARGALEVLRAHGPAARLLEAAGYRLRAGRPRTADVCTGPGGRNFGIVVVGRVLTAAAGRTTVLIPASRLSGGELWGPE